MRLRFFSLQMMKATLVLCLALFACSVTGKQLDAAGHHSFNKILNLEGVRRPYVHLSITPYCTPLRTHSNLSYRTLKEHIHCR